MVQKSQCSWSIMNFEEVKIQPSMRFKTKNNVRTFPLIHYLSAEDEVLTSLTPKKVKTTLSKAESMQI